MKLSIVPYASGHEVSWDGFCAKAVNGTFLHTRRFLSYHGDRFQDLSVLLTESDEMVGLFPAAQDPGEPKRVVSHPGATYGGIVHQGWLTGSRTIEALEALRCHYRQTGHEKLLYKPVPFIHARMAAQDDAYALFRVGARRVRCDLSSAIDLEHRLALSERRRRSLKKALPSVTLSGESGLLEELWRIVGENLAREHGARPVHSFEEIRGLLSLFPEQVLVRCALVEGKVEAGVVFFNSPRTWHAQYIASSAKGYDLCALDALFDASISEARQAGARYFDFGTSNRDEGRTLNDGLYRFKSEFGGGGVAYEFYELDLEAHA